MNRKTVIAFALVGVAACAVNPVTGRNELSLVSESQEIQMGQQGKVEVQRSIGLYDDAALAAYISGLGTRVARTTERPDLPWSFQVADQPVINAFALPGGPVFIARGLLAYFNSEAELISVLGHEMGHISARHSAQQMTRSQLAGLGLGVASVVDSRVARFAGVAQAGLGLMFLKYGRDAESQADALGFRYGLNGGWDMRDGTKMFNTLSRVSGDPSQRLPEWQSSHPAPEGRAQHNDERVAAAETRGVRFDTLRVDRNGYLRRLDGLVYGEDPRQGYFETNRFYHPEMGFQLIFPDGWKTENQPSAVVAKSSSGAMQLRLGTIRDTTVTPTQFVDSLRAHGAIVAASGHAEPFRDYPAWVGTVTAAAEGGQQNYAAGYVRIRGGQFLEVYGRGSDQVSIDQVYASIRSIAALRDPAKLNVKANRLSIKPAKSGAAFATVWAAYPHQAIGLEDAAILNGARSTTPYAPGAPVKIVPKAPRG